MSASIAKNASIMTIASIVQKIISLAYFTFVVRSIGVANSGLYTTALAITTIFVVFVDLGFTNVLIRESARQKDQIQKYFSAVLAVKIIFGVTAYAVLLTLSQVLHYGNELQNLILISGVTMLLDSFHLSMYGVLRALGAFGYEAIGMIGSQLLSCVLGAVFLFAHLPIVYLMLAYAISSVCHVGYAWFVLTHRFAIAVQPRYSHELFLRLGKIALPIAMAAIFLRVYTYIDSLMIYSMAGSVQAGWYGVPVKIVNAGVFIPLSLIAALYPKLSEYFVHDPEKLPRVFEQSVKYLLVVVAPIAVGFSLLATEVLLFFFGPEYLHSVTPLRIMLGSMIVGYLLYPIGAVLNACGRQVVQTTTVAVVMVTNILLNLWLIPAFGIVGAAWASLLSNAIFFIIGYTFASHVTRISHRVFIAMVCQIGLSAAIMGAVIWFMKSEMGLVPAIVAGMVAYPILLILTRSITRRDWLEIQTLLHI